MKTSFVGTYDQQAQYDEFVLGLLRTRAIEVDVETGKVFGRRLDQYGRRIEVGSPDSWGIKRYTVLKNGRTVVLYVKRIVYLARLMKPLTGFVVEARDGVESNLGFDNLALVRLGSSSKVRRWTAKEVSTVSKMLLKGASYADIARKIGRTGRAVKHVSLKLRHHRPPSRRPWKTEDDAALSGFVKDGLAPKDMASRLGRSHASVYLRLHRIHGWDRSLANLAGVLPDDNFYWALKGAIQRGTARSRCCVCGYSTRTDLHHIDGDRANNHTSNIATLCPNHHADVTSESGRSFCLFSSWARKNPDGILGEWTDNKDRIARRS